MGGENCTILGLRLMHRLAMSLKRLLFLRILVTLPFYIFFLMIFQLIPPVLLTPTDYCFHDLVIPPLPEVKKMDFLLYFQNVILPWGGGAKFGQKNVLKKPNLLKCA